MGSFACRVAPPGPVGPGVVEVYEVEITDYVDTDLMIQALFQDGR